MQIMPRTGHLLADLSDDTSFDAGDLEDPTLAVGYGIRYLGLLMERFGDVLPAGGRVLQRRAVQRLELAPGHAASTRRWTCSSSRSRSGRPGTTSRRSPMAMRPTSRCTPDGHLARDPGAPHGRPTGGGGFLSEGRAVPSLVVVRTGRASCWFRPDCSESRSAATTEDPASAAPRRSTPRSSRTSCSRRRCRLSSAPRRTGSRARAPRSAPRVTRRCTRAGRTAPTPVPRAPRSGRAPRACRPASAATSRSRPSRTRCGPRPGPPRRHRVPEPRVPGDARRRGRDLRGVPRARRRGRRRHRGGDGPPGRPTEPVLGQARVERGLRALPPADVPRRVGAAVRHVRRVEALRLCRHRHHLPGLPPPVGARTPGSPPITG